VIIDVVNNYGFFNHIKEFIISILLLNDSALNIPFYGYNRHLWAIPLFWWQYLFFGWLLLGKRTTKKKFIYYIILAIFTLIMGIIFFRNRMEIKIYYIIIWYLGASFAFLMGKLNNYFQKNLKQNEYKSQGNEFQLKIKIKYLSLLISLFLFILAIFKASTFKKFHDAYDLLYNVLLACSVLFFLAYIQYTSFKYPKKIKKIIDFLASYMFTLFLFHVSFFNLLLKYNHEITFFIFIHIIANILSIIIASFTEMRHREINKFLLKKLKLDNKTELVRISISNVP
jgi:peptidoglycan/LPS O-acetylase OafA/YrhL